MFKLFTLIWVGKAWNLYDVVADMYNFNEMLTFSPSWGLEFQARVKSNSIMNCTGVWDNTFVSDAHCLPFAAYSLLRGLGTKLYTFQFVVILQLRLVKNLNVTLEETLIHIKKM